MTDYLYHRFHPVFETLGAVIRRDDSPPRNWQTPDEVVERPVRGVIFKGLPSSTHDANGRLAVPDDQVPLCLEGSSTGGERSQCAALQLERGRVPYCRARAIFTHGAVPDGGSEFQIFPPGSRSIGIAFAGDPPSDFAVLAATRDIPPACGFAEYATVSAGTVVGSDIAGAYALHCYLGGSTGERRTHGSVTIDTPPRG